MDYVARQAPLCVGFSRQEYWSGLPFPSPGDLPNPGIKPGFPALQADSSLSESQGKPKVCGNSSQRPQETNTRNQGPAARNSRTGKPVGVEPGRRVGDGRQSQAGPTWCTHGKTMGNYNILL